MLIVKKIEYFKILILCFLLLFLGCDKTPEYKKVRLKPVDSTDLLNKDYKNNTIKLAIASVVSPKASLILYADLIEYLRKKMEVNIQLVQKNTYGEVNELLRNSECDVAFICTGAYIRANVDFTLDILAVPVVEGEPYYYSYIIVEKNSELTNLNDLKNKSFAFCDPLSLTGYFYVKYCLFKSGWTPDNFFSKFIFTGSHDNSIKSVAEKITDAACVDSIVYDILIKQKDICALKTKIINKSPSFGIPPVVTGSKINHEIKKKLQDAFLNMNKDEEGKKILNKIFVEKFIIPDSKIYNSAKTILEEIGAIQ
ncbi:MAG: phosphate/phosphite/phosphonate ABC transporter substrate-binding protein [Candidatus Firestonebacteria bacterium]